MGRPLRGGSGEQRAPCICCAGCTFKLLSLVWLAFSVGDCGSRCGQTLGVTSVDGGDGDQPCKRHLVALEESRIDIPVLYRA